VPESSECCRHPVGSLPTDSSRILFEISERLRWNPVNVERKQPAFFFSRRRVENIGNRTKFIGSDQRSAGHGIIPSCPVPWRGGMVLSNSAVGRDRTGRNRFSRSLGRDGIHIRRAGRDGLALYIVTCTAKWNSQNFMLYWRRASSRNTVWIKITFLMLLVCLTLLAWLDYCSVFFSSIIASLRTNVIPYNVTRRIFTNFLY
jgi:hypothetical protein